MAKFVQMLFHRSRGANLGDLVPWNFLTDVSPSGVGPDTGRFSARRLRQEGQEFKISLIYKVSSGTS